MEDLENDWFDTVGWGVLIGVALVLKPEADFHLTLVREAGVVGPQCHERLTSWMYGILHCLGANCMTAWGDMSYEVITVKCIE